MSAIYRKHKVGFDCDDDHDIKTHEKGLICVKCGELVLEIEDD